MFKDKKVAGPQQIPAILLIYKYKMLAGLPKSQPFHRFCGENPGPWKIDIIIPDVCFFVPLAFGAVFFLWRTAIPRNFFQITMKTKAPEHERSLARLDSNPLQFRKTAPKGFCAHVLLVATQGI